MNGSRAFPSHFPPLPRRILLLLCIPSFPAILCCVWQCNLWSQSMAENANLVNTQAHMRHHRGRSRHSVGHGASRGPNPGKQAFYRTARTHIPASGVSLRSELTCDVRNGLEKQVGRPLRWRINAQVQTSPGIGGLQSGSLSLATKRAFACSSFDSVNTPAKVTSPASWACLRATRYPGILCRGHDGTQIASAYISMPRSIFAGHFGPSEEKSPPESLTD